MSPPLSPRAQEILDAIERDALARRAATASPTPPADVAPAPSVEAPRAPEVEPDAADPSRLLELVDALTAQAEQARRRLGTLTAALRDVEVHPEAPVATSPAPPPVALPVADLHHHLLPGIDDGPLTLEASLELARAAVAAGTNIVATTPHVSWEYPGTTAARIAEGVAELRAALADADIPLEVVAGAEIAITRAIDLDDDELAGLRLGDGPYLLIECPLTPTATGFEFLIEALLVRGHRILLAHPERSPAFQRDPELLERLIGRGLLAQVTASSLSGAFGGSVRDFARALVGDGLVQVVASDAHSVDKRPPALQAELDEAGYDGLAAWLTAGVPGAILTGGPVPPRPELLGR
jgi:protein-tyrosine phosphatase